MVDPKMTRFKSMSLDEHAMILEQSTQGALRAREEMIAAEAARNSKPPWWPRCRKRFPHGSGCMGEGVTHDRIGATDN
jgi:hypothetical protein